MTIVLSCSDFILDAVLHAVKDIATFYKVQYKHIKCGVVGCICVLIQIPYGRECKRIGKIG